MAIHIGERIRDITRERRIGPSELGRMINTSKQNIYSIFRRKTIDTELLVKISNALDFDFFALYTERKDVRNERKSSLKPELTELKRELEFYREKCELLEKLNKYLEKELISLKGKAVKKKS